MLSHRAVDPMSVILSDEAYLRWVEMHHPDEPLLRKVADVVRSLTGDEKKFALARARALAAYGHAVVEALQGGR